jgi:hypothetical protein
MWALAEYRRRIMLPSIDAVWNVSLSTKRKSHINKESGKPVDNLLLNYLQKENTSLCDNDKNWILMNWSCKIDSDQKWIEYEVIYVLIYLCKNGSNSKE